MWLIKPIRVDRSLYLGRPGWEQIRFKCFHGRPGGWRGTPEVIDHLEALARTNPCKLTHCPDRPRDREEQ